MEVGKRAQVHQMANRVGLTSKSRGDGKDRYTVLYKTWKTPYYHDDTTVERKLNRIDGGRRSKQGGGTSSVKGRSGVAAASYREGEVVGAAAPEIGIENKGRAMLEKMGWSTGTALGALNNKGILQPVAHIVKNSKAGLG